MKVQTMMTNLEAKAGIGRVSQMLIALLLLSNTALAIGSIFIDRTVRTQLVPPQITKSFWVDGKTLSAEYLEQMGDYVIGKFATATPGSTDYNYEQLLKLVHPSVYGELSLRWKAASTKLKQDSISKIFFPREIRVDTQKAMVAVIGVQETWIVDKKVPKSEQKAFVVGFTYNGGSTHINELRETTPENPFAPPAANSGQAS